MVTDTESDETPVPAVVLDALPRGHSDDGRSRYRNSPVAHAVGVDDFRLYELRLSDEADLNASIGDRVTVAPRSAWAEDLEEVNEIAYDDLTGGARSELEYAVDELVEAEQRRFVDVYNDAQPITLRLHQLDLLPGIGDKLRNNILDERKRGPFESFADLEERVSGLHDSRGKVVERVLTELGEEDVKYNLFVTTS